MQLLLIYIVVIGAVFVFMTSRGNKKRQAQASQMQSALVVGAEVRTIGGMVGEVVEVTDEHVLIETTPGVRLRFVKSAIAGVVAPAEAAEAEEPEAEAEPEDSVEGASEHQAEADGSTQDEDSADSVQTAEPVKR